MLAQVERATHERLHNVRGPDQFTVVLDARDASTLQVTRKVTLFKDTAVALNQVRRYLLLACSAQQSAHLLFAAGVTIAPVQKGPMRLCCHHNWC